ncbi:MAG TPA: efflux RND transporter periplasmic adaptor subunit [Melioribacteraceae bacterium]|nr:efflux RND transporter periplasmic adaptor subunit [Melioribacteraceae bacterium]
MDTNIKKRFENLSKRSKIIFLSTFVVIIIVLFMLVFGSSTTEEEIPTYKVKKGNFLISLAESGELIAKNSITIPAPRVRGTLKIVYLIPEGKYVAAGEVLVKFDPTEALAKVQEEQSKLEMAMSEKDKLLANHSSSNAQMESQLKSAELSFELSKLNLEQMKFEAEAKQREAKLNHQKNELSYLQTKQEFESKKIIQNSELKKMQIEIKQRQNDLDEAKRVLDALTLTAPAEGLVVYAANWSNDGRKYTIGDTPWGGATIVTLPDLSFMQSLTSVNEVDVSKIKVGNNVVVKLDAFQDSTFEGTIANVASLGKQKGNDPNIKVFEVLVDIKGKSKILKPGMTTSNKIVINQISDVISVPQEAVFDKGKNKVVYVKDGSSYEEVKVETGEKNEDFVVITKGLEGGETVFLKDPTITEEDKGKSDNSGIPEDKR